MSDNKINWDEAVSGGAYVKLIEGEAKKLLITNWRFEKVEKFGKEQIEFQADVLEEDGAKVDLVEIQGKQMPKQFTSSSKRLKQKLRPVLENVDPKLQVTISVMQVGEKFDTQYSVKKL